MNVLDSQVGEKSGPLPVHLAKTLRAILAYTESAGYPPAEEELAGMTGLSVTQIRSHLKDLQLSGHVRRDTATARAIVAEKDADGTPIRWQFVEVPAATPMHASRRGQVA